MKWYLFTAICIANIGQPVCNLDVRLEGRGLPSEQACDMMAGLLGQAVANVGAYQVAYLCAAAENLDAALLNVLGQRRS